MVPLRHCKISIDSNIKLKNWMTTSILRYNSLVISLAANRMFILWEVRSSILGWWVSCCCGYKISNWMDWLSILLKNKKRTHWLNGNWIRQIQLNSLLLKRLKFFFCFSNLMNLFIYYYFSMRTLHHHTIIMLISWHGF